MQSTGGKEGEGEGGSQNETWSQNLGSFRWSLPKSEVTPPLKVEENPPQIDVPPLDVALDTCTCCRGCVQEAPSPIDPPPCRGRDSIMKLLFCYPFAETKNESHESFSSHLDHTKSQSHVSWILHYASVFDFCNWLVGKHMIEQFDEQESEKSD